MIENTAMDSQKGILLASHDRDANDRVDKGYKHAPKQIMNHNKKKNRDRSELTRESGTVKDLWWKCNSELCLEVLTQ